VRAQLRPDPGADPDPGGGDRAGQDGRHPVERHVEVQQTGHVLCEVGQNLVRGGPLAIHDAIGEELCPVADRLEQDDVLVSFAHAGL
jgi:hypothetical protein